jgi:4-hydroxymandelate oxidase
MGDIERAWLTNPSRRKALARMAGLVAGSPVAAAMAQIDPHPLGEHRRALSLAEIQTIFDFEPLFFGNVSRTIYDYSAHGDGTEWSLRRNRQAFDWVDIIPGRPAVAVSQVDLSSEMLGLKMKFPIVIAPSSLQVNLHPDGEIGMYRAATAASNTMMMLSANNQTPVTQVAPAVTGGTLWAQYYAHEDLATTQQWVNTFNSVGCDTVVVTVDQQAAYYPRTLHDRNFGGRGGRGAGGRGAAAGAAAAPPALTGAARYGVNGRIWYTWQHFDALRKMVKGQLLIKGIMDPEDALLSIQHGADGIVVSNHGGRSMDFGPSSLEALPEIVAAVNGRVPILFDSGIRRGADCFKALALGANAVCLGRAARWGLAAFGSAGAQRAMEILQQELVQTAATAGCTKLSDINKTKIRADFA